jgi:cytochrome bd-type quinol oxidase subunit 2
MLAQFEPISLPARASANTAKAVIAVLPDHLGDGVERAASARESLAVSLVGVAVTLPPIIAYTVYSYRVFRGKATTLSYG